MPKALSHLITKQSLRTGAINSALGVAYFVAAKLGLSLAFVHSSATAVWPPTGIAIAAVMLLGRRVWPGIALGAFLANLTTAGNWMTSLGIAAGNTLEAVAAGWLVARFAAGTAAFERPAGIFRYVVFAAVLATSISATLGVTSLALGGFVPWSGYGSVWVTWYLGDLASAIIITPLLVIWSRGRPAVAPGRVAECAVLVLLVTGVSAVVFAPWAELPGLGRMLSFLCIPPMVWAALRFGLRGTVTAVVVIDAMAIWGTLRGFGPFAANDPNVSLPLVQAFVSVISVCSLVLAAAVGEQRRAEGELAKHRDNLQELVNQRTAELAESHEHLRLAERLTALGTLTAGLGHDMGNLLLPIRARLDVLRRQPLTPEVRENTEAIGECVAYLERLTKNLRVLAGTAEESDPGRGTNLHEWWRDASPLFHSMLPAHVQLEARLREALAPVRPRKETLSQIVFNLLQNASDALKEQARGRITVWAEMDEGGKQVRLGITDDGPGMPPDVRRRCLEPFFTTKVRGVSTGLGLSVVDSLVRRAGGNVEITSEPGAGTTFVLTLPAAGADNPGGAPAPQPVALVSLRDGRAQGIASALLARHGFSVKLAAPSANDNAVVWLAEASDGVAGAVNRFLSGDTVRRVILFGTAPGVSPSARVVVFPAGVETRTMREAISAMARDLAEQAREA